MSNPSRPIFIIGSPRSGTTLLGNVLAEHPALAYSEEPRLIWRRGNDRRSDYLRAQDARPEVIASIHQSFNQFVATKNKERLLEKTPSNALRMDFMRAVYPDGIFIHVMRNPVDTVLSIRSFTAKHATGLPKAALLRRLKEIRLRQLPHYGKEAAARILPGWLNFTGTVPAWGPRLPGMKGLANELGPLETACLQWRSCVEAACQAGRTFPADQYMELRLEDLSEKLLHDILQFSRLDESPEVIETFRAKFRPADPTARQASADPEHLKLIQRWTEPTAQWLGYAKLGDENRV